MKKNKLVRDNIPEKIRSMGLEPKIHIASDEEYNLKLKEKLLEEVNEYLKSPEIDELIDILEVAYSLTSFHGIVKEELEEAREKKLLEKGGYKKRIILDETSKK